MNIAIHQISKHFATFHAVDQIDLEIPSGKLLALLGPSGSGKTTLLRMIAGIEIPDPGQGQILFDNSDVTHLPAAQRKIGFVFQSYALFNHLSVFENIAFGLRIRPSATRPKESEIRSRVLELLELIQLTGVESRYPRQLSGGQRQRVALARALAVEPKILLLDEPFGALDAKVRKDLRRWLRQLHDKIHITTIFVTHDQEEALEIADTVVVMNHGKIEQVGTPQEVYDHPANPFVYQFLGEVNCIAAHHPTDSTATVALEPIATPSIYVRPHDIDLHPHRTQERPLELEVMEVNSTGPVARLRLRRVTTGEHIEVELPHTRFAEMRLNPGEFTYATLRRARIFDKGEMNDYSI